VKITILGCGGSGGVPLIGNQWGACDPYNPKNRRSRVSVLVEEGETKILLDTSPDLRHQLLKTNIDHLSAILYTHDHADHTQGIDDVRFLVSSHKQQNRFLNAYGTSATLKTLKERFSYIFEQKEGGSSALYRPFLRPVEIETGISFTIDRLSILPFEQDHGFGTYSTGYRIGDMAYSTDVVDLSDKSKQSLFGLKLWVVDCLRWEPHITHAHFDKALNWIAELNTERAILTHLNQSMDYEEVRSQCPDGIEPGYDGLIIEI